MNYLMSSVAFATVLLMVAIPARAQEPQAEVMHWYVSAGEQAAVSEFVKAFEAQGGVWKDTAIAGGEVAIANIIARIIGGNPPAASQMPLGKQIDDLVAQNLLAPIDESIREPGGFYENTPDVFQQAITFPDGRIYAIPINSSAHNCLWINKQVLADAGVAEPVTWDDFFAAVEAIKAKGDTIPIAVGVQPWQLGQTFLSVLLTSQGPALFFKIFRELDVEAVRSPQFRQAVTMFLKLRDYSDAGSVNREWNVAANMVITGQAGFQFMGDWAKGEFVAAGQVPGVDFGCQILSGADGRQYLDMASDAFIFPVIRDPASQKGQEILEKAIMSKEVQVAFNAKKGSAPARLDVDEASLDACTVKAVTILRNPEQRVPNVDFLVSPDAIGAERDLAAQAWVDPNYTVDQFVDAFVNIIETEQFMR